MGEFKRLKELYVDATDISDEGLAYLAPLEDLEVLWLDECDISDRGIQHLLSHSKELTLDGTKVGDEGLAALTKLHGLERLDLGDTSVTLAGLGHLADFPRLRYLRLPDIEINAQLIETLSMLPNLKTLDLSNDPSEDALKLLGDLPKLEEVLVDSLLPEAVDPN